MPRCEKLCQSVRDTYSYGTAAQGIIAAASNNGQGISGINWNSPVQTIDVLGNDFGDLSLSNTTIEMINFANSQGRRLVIQGKRILSE